MKKLYFKHRLLKNNNNNLFNTKYDSSLFISLFFPLAYVRATREILWE